MRDAILKRQSTRTYMKEILSENEINHIKMILDKYNDISGPFGNSFNFVVTINNKINENGKKIGT